METDPKINFAKKIVISLVKSPIYKEISPKFDEELKTFFKVTRQFKLNEYFHIKSLQHTR
jgi:hypothetical protein